MSRLAQSPVLVAGSMVGVVVTAILAVWGLSALAEPEDFDHRMAVVDARLAELARGASARQASAYSTTALCSAPLIPAANALRDELGRQAAAANLAMTQVSVAPGGAVQPGSGLTALEIALMVEGPYADARRFLGGLQAASPEVFVDSFEVRPAVASVRLRVTGRALCWTSNRR